MTNALSTNSTAGEVYSATNGLRDIKPPLEIPSGLAWLWWLLAGAALVALLVVAWRSWLKRRGYTLPVPQVPPHLRAKQRLQEALAFIHQPREFCILVSDAVRWYLEERFDFRAPERTTEEFLYELRTTGLLLAGQKDRLGDFLQRCDLVKFAKYEPGQLELRDLHDSATRLVEETTPVPTSQSETASPVGNSREPAPPPAGVAVQ